ncbi:MAG: hypothetical protein P1S60_15825 [Anaerolineae bacterium]|nr:hypothetical protein [Anaerolineae bacterium]
MKVRTYIIILVMTGTVLLFVGLYGILGSPGQAQDSLVSESVSSPLPVEPISESELTSAPEAEISATVEAALVAADLTPTATIAPSPTASPSITYTGNPEAMRPLEPEEWARITRPKDDAPVRGSVFDGKVFIGLYGAPSGPGLGILGTRSATDTVAVAVEHALAYQALLTDSVVVPFFHMVTVVADAFAGPDGDYNHRMTTGTIQIWIDVAHQYGLASVVDIQTGYSPITTELEYHRDFLVQKDVHLAIDPEFMMPGTGGVPGSNIGHMPVETLNIAQAWLNDLALSIGTIKALIIHQFDNRMFSGKDEIIDYPMVDLVWDSDGFGGPGAKIGDYRQYAAEPGFEYGGFKLFYNWDTPVMTPAQVLGLDPRPVFVVYQ